MSSLLRVVSLSLCLLFAISFKAVHGQDTDSVYRFVEEMPFWKGCGDKSDRQNCSMQYFHRYQLEHVVWPNLGEQEPLVTAFYISFTVEKDGSISEVKALKNPDHPWAQSAVSAVASMPDWEPGKQNGIPVKVRLTIPIRVHPK